LLIKQDRLTDMKPQGLRRHSLHGGIGNKSDFWGALVAPQKVLRFLYLRGLTYECTRSFQGP
jgi:hypothetical protein